MANRHLQHLDGLRAAAALAVLVYHALSLPPASPYPAALAAFLDRWLINGQLAVVVFIVLSGYCLMLPVASAEDERLRGGFWGFFRRRFWRIYPPYLANIVCGVAFLYLLAFVARHGSGLTTRYAESVRAWDLVSHLLMVHVFRFDTVFTINGVLWSVGTEWWIYVVFAAALLPVWRRWGVIASTVAAVVLGYLPAMILPTESSFYWARPWYIASFGFGMAAAALYASKRPGHVRANARLPWGGLSAALGLLLAGLYVIGKLGTTWILDTVVGLAAACVLGWLTTGGAARARTWLERPWLQAIGACSYTLYLFHPFVLKAILGVGGAQHVPPTLVLIANVVVGIPLSVVIAHFLAMVLERPFLRRRK